MYEGGEVGRSKCRLRMRRMRREKVEKYPYFKWKFVEIVASVATTFIELWLKSRLSWSRPFLCSSRCSFTSTSTVLGGFVSAFSSHTACMCVYLVCIGEESHGLCQFSFALRKCAAGQMEKGEKLNRPRANRYTGPLLFHIHHHHNQPSWPRKRHLKIAVAEFLFVFFFVFFPWLQFPHSVAVQQPSQTKRKQTSPAPSRHHMISSSYQGRANHRATECVWAKCSAVFPQIRWNG